MGIDYFSRYIFAKNLQSKQAHKVLDFVKKVHEKMPIKVLIADNGKEFHNNEFEKWAKENKIQVQFSVPYFHESNGRIERANRTIRESLKRTRGPLKIKLQKVVEAYNQAVHRGIGIAPIDALDIKNSKKVIQHQEIYKKEFGLSSRENKPFKIGDTVLIKNENKKSKMDYEFKDIGYITKCEGKGVYEVRRPDRCLVRRHHTQLKGFKKGDVDTGKYQVGSLVTDLVIFESNETGEPIGLAYRETVI